LFFVSGKNIVFIALKKRVSAVKIHDRCNGKKLYLPLNLLNIVLIQYEYGGIGGDKTQKGMELL
jgi:hypothetical protein